MVDTHICFGAEKRTPLQASGIHVKIMSVVMFLMVGVTHLRYLHPDGCN